MIGAEDYSLSPLAVVFLLLKTQPLVLFQRSMFLFPFWNHFHVALQGKLLRETSVVYCISSYLAPRDLCLCYWKDFNFSPRTVNRSMLTSTVRRCKAYMNLAVKLGLYILLIVQYASIVTFADNLNITMHISSLDIVHNESV